MSHRIASHRIMRYGARAEEEEEPWPARLGLAACMQGMHAVFKHCLTRGFRAGGTAIVPSAWLGSAEASRCLRL